MNVIDGINLAGMVAVLGFVCALARYLIQDIKQLSGHVARVEGFLKGKFRTLQPQ